MAFFKSLKSIGITREDLGSLTNADVIRIEKLLIAEQKLNDKVSKNDIAQVLEVLTNYPDVVREICSYDCFYGILTGYDAELIDTLRRYDTEQLQRINYVVSNYFIDELTHYLNVNLNANNINNLRVLFFYKDFFDNGFIKTFTKRLESKFEYAFTVLNSKPWQGTLRKKIRYLSDPEFYKLLGEVDNRVFIPQIANLFKFIGNNIKYTNNSSFFKKMVYAFANYDPENLALRNSIDKVNNKKTTLNWEKLPQTIIFCVIIAFARILTFTSSSNSNSSSNYYNNSNSSQIVLQPTPSTNMEPFQEAQKLKMDKFIDDRLNTINYPIESWKYPLGSMELYQNPFNSKLFAKNNDDIFYSQKVIIINNNTSKECVALAYYHDNFNDAHPSTNNSQKEDPMNIYALYIPPGDSIYISSRLVLLRLYMGRRLARFKPKNNDNDYKVSEYDVKFSKFTAIDSLLLAEGYRFNHFIDTGISVKPKMIITQPTKNSYQLAWTGQFPLLRLVKLDKEEKNYLIDTIRSELPLQLNFDTVQNN